ncbi:MAG: hypothetical protein KKE44_04435, partial [Proteobacteria bacterium]|nr:hypothetical protein [Pseudomonadota bacterium]
MIPFQPVHQIKRKGWRMATLIRFTPNRCARSVLFLISIMLLVLWGGLFESFAAIASNDTAQNMENVDSIESIDKTIESLDITIDKITRTQTDKLANELGTASDQIQKKMAGLNALRSVHVRLKNALLGLEKVKKEQQAIEQLYEDYRTNGMIKKPPYSLTFHDSIQAQIFTATKNKKNIELTIELLKKNHEEFQNQLAQKEKELRQVKETPEQQSSGNTIALEVMELSIQHLITMVHALTIEMERYEIENRSADIKIKLLKEQASFVGSNIHHDKEDLNHQLELIQNKEIAIQNDINNFKIDQKAVDQEWIKARQTLDAASLEQERNTAQAFLKARDEWRKTYILVLELEQDSLVLLNQQKAIWQKRYAIVEEDLPFSQKIQIKDETEKNINSLNQTLQIQQNYLVNLQKQISAIEGLMQEEVSPSIKNHFLVEMDALRKQFDRRLEFQSMIVATDQVERNLLAQVEKQMDQRSVKDRFSGFGQALKNLWNLEIWVVDQQPVSVG